MAMAPEKAGIGIRRHFTVEGTHPYDELAWDRRDARITNFRDGTVAFEQTGVEFPSSWSQNATNIVAQKYFRGSLGSPERERSLRQVVDRVVDTIAAWGRKDGYFVDEDEAAAFQAELKHLMVQQKAAFNSPVWFNIGVRGEPQQASACQPWGALVSTPEGLVPIGVLVDDRAVGTKVFDAHGLTSVVAVKANGRKLVLRIHTTAGYTLDVTGDHQVWVSGSGFVPAGRISPGDQLEWHQAEGWGDGEITQRTVAEAGLAGWIQAGGFVVDVGGKGVAGGEVTVNGDAEERWVRQALADALPHMRLHDRVGGSFAGAPGRRFRLEGTGLAAFVQRWRLARTGPDAAVPAALFTAPLPVVAAYLRSLFQAEGWLSNTGAVIGLAMASEPLVRGVQTLLLRFGVFSHLRRVAEQRAGGSDFWVLNVRVGTDGRRFADEIGFLDPARAQELDAALAKADASPPRAADGYAASGPHTSRLVDVESVEVLGEMPVYDIQTESGEYLSGNLRVHNCFILAVDDTMRSILNWYVEEGTIFKGGSGAGINLSTIRSSQESLKGGGAASGPVSFMRGADASAGTIKCLHAATPIATDHGVVPIAEVRAGWRVATRFGERRVEAVHDNGVRPLVRVRTELGDELLCTPEHRFWVRGSDGAGWRRAAELRADDHLVLDLSSPYAGSPQPLEAPAERGKHTFPCHLDEQLALWLGWMSGDGSIRTTPAGGATIALELARASADLDDRFRRLTRSVFGTGLVFTTRAAAAGERPDAPATVRFSSAGIAAFLAANGLTPGEGADARVPAALASSPATVRAAFLAGLFEADGHVGTDGAPTLSTTSAGLALDVHRLLLSLGIPSIVGPVDDRLGAFGTRSIHRVQVVGTDGVSRFAKLVGFLSEAKSAALEASVAEGGASLFEDRWFVPHLDDALAAQWSVRRLSLRRARLMADRFDTPELLPFARFAAGEELYVTATVEPAGEGPTFDLTVAGVHEYLVDNLVTHNSGGKTRRAAKMVILNADHPDVEDFIWCKAVEERKARVLRDAGFDMDLDGKDSHSTQYQNANNSVRVTDEFMEAVVEDRDWELRAVTSGAPLRTMRARDLFRQIAQAAWECADPGMQFDTTINRWHTAANTGRINASNPCSEYMHLDNSACNLASVNLLKFLGEDGRFDVDGFRQAVEVVFTAQEILVGNADYPTEKIAENSRRFRQLGLGYANLGAMLMALGLPYDSDEGRAWAAAITALMTGHAYAVSARIASRMGPFAGYAKNAEPMNRVLGMHRDASLQIDDTKVPVELLSAAQEAWEAAVDLAEWFGVRNAQASVLAPTGCLVGGTLVPTERGLVRLRSLGDPDGERWQPLGIDVATDDGPRAASQFYVNGLEPVVDVVTRRGHRIQGTPTHRVKVVDPATGEWEWRRFADIRPGNLVPLALDQLVGDPQTVLLPPLPEMCWTGERHVSAPDSVTPELAEIVGYFMGDGSLHSRGLRFCVSAADFDVADRLAQLGKNVFGIGARLTAKKGYTEVAFHSVRLARWWEACGFAKRLPADGHTGTGWSPHIPDAILHANDREVYGAFLRGLFEADGTVTTGHPCWSSTDEEFVQDVQRLHLALGFPTTVHTSSRSDRGGTRPIAVLRLLNTAHGERWRDQIGFMGDRKNAAVAVSSGRQAAQHDHIPLSRALIDRLAPANDGLRKVLLMEHARGTVSRRIATELHARTNDPELGRLLGYFYDRVIAAELGDEEFTYDLSVPSNVTYVANGFVSHNTIGLMLDCDTTGIEPDLGLCKTKKLVGGGTMSIVNQTVPRALRRLGYGPDQVSEIIGYIDEHKSIVGAPHLRADHLPVFACSMGDNVIHYLGHVNMMGAVQPFISGAISKTINMPETVTVDEVEQLHIDAWKLGLKAVAIYRDNCKVAQPLSTTKKADALAAPAERLVATVVDRQPIRERLPRRRSSKTFSFRVADCHGYVTVGEYDDGRPGEIFLKVAKQGSTLAGIMDAFAISVSHGLQYGVPLKAFVDMYTNMRFEPAGMTDDPDIRFASSLVDYIFRRLAVEYLPLEDRMEIGILTIGERMQPTLPGVEESATPSSTGSDLVPDPAPALAPPAPSPPAAVVAAPIPAASDAPYCYQCGMVMQRAGACFVCSSCGTTSGCS